MVEISNVRVYNLEEAVISCRNAMRTVPPEITFERHFEKEFKESLPRAEQLAKSPSNSGHCNFLKGILVSYDIKYPQYFTPELQRYTFNEIICSASKMHRLCFHIDKNSFNKYVDDVIFDRLQELVQDYEEAPSYENWMRVLSNTPLGLELFMHCTTNYLQLKNIYHQRKNHKLQEDWGAFCKFIEELPYFNEFINPKND